MREGQEVLSTSSAEGRARQRTRRAPPADRQEPFGLEALQVGLPFAGAGQWQPLPKPRQRLPPQPPPACAPHRRAEHSQQEEPAPGAPHRPPRGAHRRRKPPPWPPGRPAAPRPPKPFGPPPKSESRNFQKKITQLHISLRFLVGLCRRLPGAHPPALLSKQRGGWRGWGWVSVHGRGDIRVQCVPLGFFLGGGGGGEGG